MAAPVLPLRFEPILLPKVWGGDRLSRYGKAVAQGDRIGESWEIADLSSTSPGGGGGGAKQSVVASGPYAGRMIREVLGELGASFLGETQLAADGSFPLLIKLLDARENLSVQVHPGPGYVAAHPEAHLKAESWIVLEAEAGSKIYAGLRDGVTVEDVARGIREGRVPELLCAIPARREMLINLPSGVIHALGAGVLVAEMQTASDTTFRVFDWGRTDRQLHIAQALECIGEEPRLQATCSDTAAGDGSKENPYFGSCTTPYYSVETFGEIPNSTLRLEPFPWCAVCMVVGGGCELVTQGEHECVEAGQTLLLPAYWEGDMRIGGQGMRAIYLLVGDTRGQGAI